MPIMVQAYPTIRGSDTAFYGLRVPLRDETVAIRDELDIQPHTNGPLAASHWGVSLNHRRRDVMGKLATKMLLLGGIAGLSLAGAAGAATPLADAPALVVQYSDATLATDS